MKRMKKILFVFMAILLILPSFLVSAESNQNKTEEETSESKGNISSKDEVVYATLGATGDSKEIFVVNTFDVAKAGTIVDYGHYESLKNLTDLSKIEQNHDTVEFQAAEGKFYYQGNMNNESLPWNISISYFLDGEKMNPEELAGKDGHVEIHIETTANKQVDPLFFENYLLQISMTLDPTIYSNIQAPDGMIANAGKNKQVTFTVMPEKEEEFVLEAEVDGFELDGIEFTGVPSSMSIDSPDMDDVTGDMESLTDAIAEVNNGVGELRTGVSDLNSGVSSLRDGSAQYKQGMSDISAGSSDLIQGSKSIDQALVAMSSSLDVGEVDLSELEKLATGLKEISKGLNESADGLDELKEGYTSAYTALDEAMQAIPEHEISEEEFQELYMSGADPETVDKLVETYEKALIAKGTYTNEDLQKAFKAVDPTLTEVSNGLKEMATNMDTMASELDSSLEGMDVSDSLGQLQEGLEALSSNYKDFHSGLTEYTNGVGQLANSYHELHAGIEELSGGTNELENGVAELHNGTNELYESTNDLPDQMKEEVDQMVSEYDKSDIEPVSFVSSKNNDKIQSVQFIISTDSIQIEEPETVEAPKEEEKGFWDRLMDLFS
ncbi:YhgE/Pip domain-containing protein [Oceanobacillus halophilus]